MKASRNQTGSSKNAVRTIHSTTLPNGLRIITEAMTHVRSVSLGIWVDSGSRRETPAESGISHFIEHMVFKGTPTRSAEDIARSLDSLGGNLDAFTGKELVCFNVKVLDEHLPTAFDVLSDMMLNPMFRPEDIEKEKGVILEEMKMEVDNPEYLVHETFSSNFWRGHPLGQSIIGNKQTVKSFDARTVRNFYRSVYTPAQIIVTAAGNLAHQQIVDMVAARFAALPARAARKQAGPPEPQARIVLKDKKALEQVHLLAGVPAYPVAHPRRFSAYVLNALLGGSMSSRLFQTIREQRGLAYAVFSELNAYRDSGVLTVYAGTSRQHVPQVLELVTAELHRMKTEPVPPEELDRGKNHLKGSVMLGLESTSSRMSNLARQELYFGRFATLDEIVAEIDAVTAESVQATAHELFRPAAMGLTVVGRLNGLRVSRGQLAC
ncbi:MAG: insulinase family protein [Bryobacterales bacterium]|nr:insulinase family protein [Bryobacterales bacterium]